LRSFRFDNFTGTPYGTTLPPGATLWIINDMFTEKTWSYDPNAIYLVILGKGIKESVATGFNLCTDYCGHHSTALNKTAQNPDENGWQDSQYLDFGDKCNVSSF
jgi:hypothetical protein